MENKSQIFINKSQNIHKHLYDYSLVEYKNNYTKVKIICSRHGEFEQEPKAHTNGSHCPKCASCKRGKKSFDNNYFIKNSNIKHNNRYDYSLVNYINRSFKVEIICPIHGIFKQKPESHLNGCGCNKCSNKVISFKDFIEKSINKHGLLFDYSLVNYKNINTKVKIICSRHGEFEQKPAHHLSGSGCPRCKNSKGEKFIFNFLKNNNIEFESQKRFIDCRNKYTLAFDFYIPSLNTCIEYDGEQHFKPIKIFGGDKALKMNQTNDEIKNQYCINKKITLIRIKYNEDKLLILKNILNMKH